MRSLLTPGPVPYKNLKTKLADPQPFVSRTATMRTLLGLLVLAIVGMYLTPGAPAQDQAKDKKKGKIVTTKSGLKYEDLKVGTGPEAKRGDGVEVHYTGWLKDGKKFDSSKDRGEPFPFQLG